MKYTHIIYIAALVGLNGCVQDTKTADEKKEPAAVAKAAEITDAETKTAFTSYLQLKDALVKGNTATAKTASASLAEVLKGIEGCEPTSKVAGNIAASADLTEQRKQFVILSADFIPLVKHTTISSGSIFVQFCPMANEGKGAFWLASEKEINNPYYGDEMLECGEVTEVLKAK